MDQPSRYPSKQDFETGRKFCVISLLAKPGTFRYQVLSESTTIQKGPGNGDLRINPYGLFDGIALGVLKPTATSAFCTQGVMIDYAENKEALLDAAQTTLDGLKQKYLLELEEIKQVLLKTPLTFVSSL